MRRERGEPVCARVARPTWTCGPSTFSLYVAMTTPQQIHYKRRLRKGLLYAIGLMFAFALLTQGLDPIDTTAKRVFLASTAVVIGALGLLAVRRYPIAPCPFCRSELYEMIMAAQRTNQRLQSCPKCGNAVDV
jgi:hypothetical protein